MTSKFITFLSSETKWLAKKGDSDTLIFKYVIADSNLKGDLDNNLHTQKQCVKIKISGTTMANWEFVEPGSNLGKVLHQFALDLIREKVRDGTLAKNEELILSNNAPEKCPYVPEKIHIKFDEPIELQVNRPLGFKLP